MTDPGASPLPAAPVEIPALAFADAEGAKAWVKTLPFGSVAQMHDAVLGQLRALAAAQQSSRRERATIAEVMRDPGRASAHRARAPLRRQAAARGRARARGRRPGDRAVARAVGAVFATCLKPLLEGDPELAGVKAKLLQRGLYVGKQLVVVHGLARRAPPPALWQELHAYYRLAEMLDCAVTAVSDDLMPNGVGISCYSTYSHALLLGLADPYAMSVKQIELADRWLAMWARKIFPYAQQRESEGPVLIVDLDVDRRARRSSRRRRRRRAADAMRFGYPVQARDQRPRAAEAPAGRRESGGAAARARLQRRAVHDAARRTSTRSWYQPPRRVGDRRRSAVELCAGGLAAAYFRVGGRTFDREDPLGRVYAQKAPAPADAGRADRLRPRPRRGRAQLAVGALAGRLRVARGARCTRDRRRAHRWMLDQLVVVREDDRVRLGYVTRVVADGGRRALAVAAALAGDAEVRLGAAAVARRCPRIRRCRRCCSPRPPRTRRASVLPPRTFSPGPRAAHRSTPGTERKFRLTRLAAARRGFRAGRVRGVGLTAARRVAVLRRRRWPGAAHRERR